MEANENKIEVERKFTIFAAVMIVLMCLSIFLIQKSDTDLSEARMKDKAESAVKESAAIAKQDQIFTVVTSSENKVNNIADEVHGIRKDVAKSNLIHEKSLNKFNNLKSQNEKVYIPNATADEQTDFISNYKYEPIGAN